VNGVWIINGTVNITQDTVIGTTKIAVNGSLYVSPNVTIQINISTPQNFGSVNVSGCADFSGGLNIVDFDGSNNSSATQEFNLMQFEDYCSGNESTNQFDNVTVTFPYLTECKPDYNTEYTDFSLLLLTKPNPDGCAGQSSTESGGSAYKLILILTTTIVGGFIIVVIIVVVIGTIVSIILRRKVRAKLTNMSSKSV